MALILTQIRAWRRIPIRWHQGSQLGLGWHSAEGSVAEGPLQGAAGAVGDKAPQGLGAGAKIGQHHQLARLPPDRLAPQH